jgi:S1-C subfamily serine protease
MDLKEKHEKFLYPAVRVFSISKEGGSAAGSGTIIYSKPDPDNKEEFITLVLTNHHVVENLISYKKDWDSLLKRERQVEFKEHPKVETFSYVNTSKMDSSNRFNGEIIAYDKNEDLAILRLETPRKFKYVAQMIPKEEIKEIKLFTDVVVVGCSLAHEPFANFGQITYLSEIIDQKKYLMTNANSIFGNSGGALYIADSGYLIGVPSRITGIQLGFGTDIMTWMGFSAHPDRIYDFIDNQELKFVYDDSDTYQKAMERRDKKEREAITALKAELLKEEAKD